MKEYLCDMQVVDVLSKERCRMRVEFIEGFVREVNKCSRDSLVDKVG